ncbi:hypothetical protein HGM15179_016039 [Zosterops borbonicus]|uniref:Uncharacterized protein n=1 Tax=Zosterops borbonicus TaxID=364589 RepID=A0A8K1G3D1_9PASS|nr:hypothetical protein HGM15179_016039 [Zosterops borbonicus]
MFLEDDGLYRQLYFAPRGRAGSESQGLLNSPKVLSGERRGKCIGEQQITIAEGLRGKLFVRYRKKNVSTNSSSRHFRAMCQGAFCIELFPMSLATPAR